MILLNQKSISCTYGTGQLPPYKSKFVGGVSLDAGSSHYGEELATCARIWVRLIPHLIHPSSILHHPSSIIHYQPSIINHMGKWTIGQLGNLGTSASIVVLLLFLLPEVPSWQWQRFILYIELAWPARGLPRGSRDGSSKYFASCR